MESFLEHFVHMVLCKCAVVLIKAENMKPSLCDAVRQGKNAETIVSKGNALPNKDVFIKKKKIRKKKSAGKDCMRHIFRYPLVSTVSHIA